jgi:hypothetical protein
MQIVDIEKFPVTTKPFLNRVEKIREIVEYAESSGHQLSRVQVFPEDYDGICRAISAKYAKDAREAARAAGVKGRSRDQRFPPQTFDGICFRRIPVERGVRSSRAVRV